MHKLERIYKTKRKCTYMLRVCMVFIVYQVKWRKRIQMQLIMENISLLYLSTSFWEDNIEII